jgi:NAD(P)-dependent dehydrogenase (short-subunit alcohol dehydrogenase family)
MRGLSGKRFIIGGGATGMGAALAMQLVTAGGRVVVGDINQTGLTKLAERLRGKPGKGIVMVFDLADDPSIQRLVQRCVDEFGGLDGVAITGADLSPATMTNDRTVVDTEMSVWERTLRVNLLGHVTLIKEAIPHLKKAGGGAIVSVSSGAAFMGMADKPAYSCSKAAIHALVRHTARIAGKDKIRCNAVAPGLVLTEAPLSNLTREMIDEVAKQVPLPRLGEADDLASAMAFLLSDEASWITGQVLSVNGGVAFRD